MMILSCLKLALNIWRNSMPQSTAVAVENNFTKGLITESTGLNFPENAATDTDNCLYTLVGDVTRRQGIDFEANFLNTSYVRVGNSINTYIWNNVGGDGLTKIEVVQIGDALRFYRIDTDTITNPLSTQLLVSSVTLEGFVAAGATLNTALECDFFD